MGGRRKIHTSTLIVRKTLAQARREGATRVSTNMSDAGPPAELAPDNHAVGEERVTGGREENPRLPGAWKKYGQIKIPTLLAFIGLVSPAIQNQLEQMTKAVRTIEARRVFTALFVLEPQRKLRSHDLNEITAYLVARHERFGSRSKLMFPLLPCGDGVTSSWPDNGVYTVQSAFGQPCTILHVSGRCRDIGDALLGGALLKDTAWTVQHNWSDEEATLEFTRDGLVMVKIPLASIMRGDNRSSVLDWLDGDADSD